MWKRWRAMVLAVSLLLSFGDPRGETNHHLSSTAGTTTTTSSRRLHDAPAASHQNGRLFFHHQQMQEDKKNSDASASASVASSPHPPSSPSPTLEYDFYRHKCPQAEGIIRSTVVQLFSRRPSVAPSLLRLAFHDCFIQGCDASVLLESSNRNGSRSEKNAVPNQTLKAFDVIDVIKSKVEEACPATVSCADIVVLAARDGVVLAGGPFYPVLTGRRDSTTSYYDVATNDLPAPNDDLTTSLSKFAARGFSERETVSLLGAHNIGTVRCSFLMDRLYNFENSGIADASLDAGFLEEMRMRCPNTTTTAASPTPEDADNKTGIAMGYDVTDVLRRTGFDNHYYKTLVQGRGILHADQQLMAGRSTAMMVMEYASDGIGLFDFRRDFARAMVKMSRLGALLGSKGQIRVNCSRLAA